MLCSGSHDHWHARCSGFRRVTCKPPGNNSCKPKGLLSQHQRLLQGLRQCPWNSALQQGLVVMAPKRALA